MKTRSAPTIAPDSSGIIRGGKFAPPRGTLVTPGGDSPPPRPNDPGDPPTVGSDLPVVDPNDGSPVPAPKPDNAPDETVRSGRPPLRG
jgi:hypothetical protein